MTTREPQVGDVVHLYMKTAGDDPDDPMPDPIAAMITSIDEDWNADLMIFPPRKLPGWTTVSRRDEDPDKQFPIPYSLFPERGCWSPRPQ